MNSKDFLKVATPEMIDVMNAEANRMAADLAALRAENAKLREALRFYAERKNYGIKDASPNSPSWTPPVLCDGGEQARAALA